MKKLLSILCAVTLLISCMAGITVSATEFPYAESLVFDDFLEITDAEWGNDGSGTPFVHTISIPLGWEWFYTGDMPDGINWQAGNILAERQRSKPYLAADEKTYLQRTGGDITVGKIVDIEPGFTYTATTTAYTKTTSAGGGRSSIEYFLYHNNGDGTYTPINEYLDSINFEGLDKTYGNGYLSVLDNGEATIWDNVDAKTGTVSVEFAVTNEYADAVMIGLGGFSGTNDHIMHAVWYDSFEITQGETVELIPAEKKKNYVYIEEFKAEDAVEKEVSLVSQNDKWPYTYTNTHKLPGADWNLEKIDVNHKDYQVGWYETNTTGGVPAQVKQSTATKSGRTYYQIPGSAMVVTKMIDIEPGFEYTFDIDADAYGSYIASGQVWFYHKNDDGRYTPINTYLSENNFQHTLETVKFNKEDNSTNVLSSHWASGFNDRDLVIDFAVTDANVNAIKIGLGGLVSNESSVNWFGNYYGCSLAKGEAVEMIPNDQPPYLTVENDGAAVRYTPAEAGETPSIIIAAYAVDENGVEKLEKLSITKPEAVNGVYDAAYDMDLSDIEGTVTVKAFVWDMAKNIPLARSIQIQ